MSLNYHGNHLRAARIARQLVKHLDPSDVEWHISETMKYPAEHDQLLTAVEPKYSKIDQRRHEVCDRLEAIVDNEEAKSLLGEYFNICLDLENAKQLAWFHLGFASATRLLGTPPTMDILNGGNAEPKLKGIAKL